MEILKAIQHRNSRPFLEEPAPSEQEMREVYKAALRAPEHAWLRPWRHLEVRGEGRKKLADAFIKASKASDEIGKYCKLLASSHEAIKICENKFLMYEHFKGKMEVPEYYLVNTLEELENAASKLGYPSKDVVFKPPEGKGARGVRVMTEKSDRYELLFKGRPYAKYISMDELKKTKDPRLVEGGLFFETPPMAGPVGKVKGRKKK